MSDTITIHGKQFATSKEGVNDSVVGYVTTNKRWMHIFDVNGKIQGCINCHGVICKTRDTTIEERGSIGDKHKYWYSYGKPDILGEISFKEQDEIVNTVSKGKDRLGYYFK